MAQVPNQNLFNASMFPGQYPGQFDMFYNEVTALLPLNYTMPYLPQSQKPPEMQQLSGSIAMNKSKRTRTTFTNEQLSEMEKEFQISKYLNPTRLSEICAKLGLGHPQVKIWFKNRRRKFKIEEEQKKEDLTFEKDKPKPTISPTLSTSKDTALIQSAYNNQYYSNSGSMYNHRNLYYRGYETALPIQPIPYYLQDVKPEYPSYNFSERETSNQIKLEPNNIGEYNNQKYSTTSMFTSNTTPLIDTNKNVTSCAETYINKYAIPSYHSYYETAESMYDDTMHFDNPDEVDHAQQTVQNYNHLTQQTLPRYHSLSPGSNFNEFDISDSRSSPGFGYRCSMDSINLESSYKTSHSANALHCGYCIN